MIILRRLTTIGAVALMTLILLLTACSANANARIHRTACDGTKQVADYQYAPKDPVLQVLTATTLDCRSNAPWIVLIHGGSWINGDRSSMYPATDVFYNAGYQVFNADYRRGDHVNWLMQQRDLLAIYRWVSDNAAKFGLDMAKGSLYGFSAGGHMAAWLGNAEPSISSVITVSGVLQPQRVAGDDNGARPDTEPTTPQMHNLHLREIDMMGCDWGMGDGPDDPTCLAAWQNFMPETTITPDSPPMYMLQGDLDPIVPHPTPDAYAWHLAQFGVPSQVLHDDAWGHTQHLFLYQPDRQTTILNWMQSQWH